jgi:hypothetical protein
MPETTLSWNFLNRREFEGRSYGNSALYATPQTIPSLIRETGQNSLDAGSGGPVVVRYGLYDLPIGAPRTKEFLEALEFESLKKHIHAASKGGGQRQTAARLRAALKDMDAHGSVLRLLRIDDYGAKGLAGPEFGPHGAFSALVRDVENSEKGNQTAGGSFGLGAKTLWSCSKLLTVVFASQIHGEEDVVRLIGKADLGFHDIEGEGAHGYVGEGFFGEAVNDEGGAHSVLLPQTSWLLESLFLQRHGSGAFRSGTSALIVGFHDPTSDSEESGDIIDRIKKSIAENFWPAIVLGQMKAEIEWHHAHEAEPVLKEIVDPHDYVPSFVDCLEKHLANDVKASLETPGDVVSVPVPLTIPAAREGGGLDPEHGEVQAEARLVIRLASPDCGDRQLTDHIACTRGRAMVTKYLEKRGISAGARSYHAVLLAGTIHGDGDIEQTAEKFLRFAEPPSHDEWKLWSGLKARYATGAGRKLADFFAAITSRLSDYITTPPTESDEGPPVLQRMFKLPKTSAPKQAKYRLLEPQIELVDRTYFIRGTIAVDALKSGRLTPKAFLAAESGKPSALPWEEVKFDGVTSGNATYDVTRGKKNIEFEGRVAGPDGVQLEKCAVKISIHYSGV